MFPCDPFLDGVSAENVFGDDSAAAFGGDGAVPDALGVNKQPWAPGADAEAGGLGAEGTGVEVLREAFEFLPGFESGGGCAAVRSHAEEEVAAGVQDLHFAEERIVGGRLRTHGGRAGIVG